MKKIVIDARESGTSTGRYIDKVIEHMHTLHPAFDITVLTKPHRVDFIKNIAPTFTVVPSPHKEFTFAEQISLKKQLENLQPDLVHFGMVQQPIFYRGLAVTTMHDLTTLRFRNPSKNAFIFKCKQMIYSWVNKIAAKKSAAIITGSRYVKEDVLNYTHVQREKITVTYEAAEAITDTPTPFLELVGKKFIMYVGRPTPHKNLERLVQAFKQLNDARPDLYLVLAGKKDANYLGLVKYVLDQKINNVVFTDFIPDSTLRWLYENCSAYLFPSLSEGFGLPGLEAMRHGAPVISSSATCLPEIYGDAAHYFDPHDTNAIRAAIDKVLTDTEYRNALIREGKIQAQKYSWNKTAQQTLAVYQSVLNK